MAKKRLGAIASTGTITTADTLYTCPSGKSAVVATIAICNQAASPATFRICQSTTTSFATAGYLTYGTTVPANDTILLTIGLCVDDVNKYLLCSASAATVSFSAWGAED